MNKHDINKLAKLYTESTQRVDPNNGGADVIQDIIDAALAGELDRAVQLWDEYEADPTDEFGTGYNAAQRLKTELPPDTLKQLLRAHTKLSAQRHLS